MENKNEEEIRIKTKIIEKIKEMERLKEKDIVDEFGIHSRDWWVADVIQEQLEEIIKEG